MNYIKYNNFRDYLMKFQQRVHVLIAPPLLVFVFLFIKIENGRFHPVLLNGDLNYYIRWADTSISIALTLAAILIQLLNVRKISSIQGLRPKLDHFFSVSLFRYYLLETGLVINLVSLGLTAEKLYTGIFGIMLIVFLLGYPAMWRIINALKLSQKDTEIILRMEPIE
jgi:hypothetical protein